MIVWMATVTDVSVVVVGQWLQVAGGVVLYTGVQLMGHTR